MRSAHPHPRRWLFVAGLTSLCLLAGCPVDSRALEPATDAGGRAGSAGGLQASAGSHSGTSGEDPLDGIASAASAGAGGASGEGGKPPVPTVDGCADLDGNGIADCKETVVINSDFKQDTSGWAAEADATLTWDTENAIGDLPSGSALVASIGVIDADANGAALRAASQCVSMPSKQLVTAYANALVEAGQDSQGLAEVDVFFFDGDNCEGTFTGSFSTPQPTDGVVGSWITLRAGAVSSDTAKSALVKLAISKPFRAASFRARFDNVLVKLQSP